MENVIDLASRRKNVPRRPMGSHRSGKILLFTGVQYQQLDVADTSDQVTNYAGKKLSN